MITIGDIKKTILDSIELDDDASLDEAYVATPKKFNLSTELLSSKAKDTHNKLYLGYIEKLNRVSSELDVADRASANCNASVYRSLKVAEVRLRNAVYLHELHFANISDVHSELAFDSLCYMKFSRDFGTFDDWQWDFIACALSAKGGWAATVYDTFLKRYANVAIDGHETNVPFGCYPVVVLDVFEHSYMQDYQTDVGKYVSDMMRELNWEIIEKRVERAEQIAKVLEKQTNMDNLHGGS